MHFSPKSFNPMRPNPKLTSKHSDYASSSPGQATNLKIISIQSNSFDISSKIPCHEINFTNSSLSYTFLSYKSIESPQNQIMSFFNNLGFETQKISNFDDDSKFSIESQKINGDENTLIIVLKNPKFCLGQLKLKLSSLITKDSVKSLVTIREKIKSENFQILPYLNLFTKELRNFENEDKFLLNCLKTEFFERRKRNFIVENEVIRLVELNSYMDCLRKVEICVSVKNQVIRLEYILNHEDYLGDSTLKPEVIENIKSYIEEINKNIYQGKFYWSGKICFKYSYHSFLYVKQNMSTYPLIRRDLDLINLHIPHFQEILTGKVHSIAQLINHSKLLKLLPKFKFKSFQLPEVQIKKTLSILEILNTKKDLFLSNRFNHKRIQINAKENILICPVPNEHTEFDQMVLDHPTQVIQSIVELIEQLGQIGLYFNNSFFPLSLFIWYEEKPVFNYSIPLHELLSISQEPPAILINNTKESVLIQLIQLNSAGIEKDSQSFDINEARELLGCFELRRVEETQINNLIAMNQSNSSVVSKTCSGICRLGDEKMLIFNGVTKKNLLQALDQMDLNRRLKVFVQIFDLIRVVLDKNSEISCIDLECIVFYERKKVKLEIKSVDQVLDEFKAPEVKSGRKARASLIYSFGKITQVLFEGLVDGQKGWDLVQEIVEKCTLRVVSRRISLELLGKLVRNVINTI